MKRKWYSLIHSFSADMVCYFIHIRDTYYDKWVSTLTDEEKEKIFGV